MHAYMYMLFRTRTHTQILIEILILKFRVVQNKSSKVQPRLSLLYTKREEIEPKRKRKVFGFRKKDFVFELREQKDESNRLNPSITRDANVQEMAYFKEEAFIICS